jgi:uncharacterized membrane protein YvbJ
VMSKEEIKAALAREKEERRLPKKAKTIYWSIYAVTAFFLIAIIFMFFLATYESPEVKAIKEETTKIKERAKQAESELRRIQQSNDNADRVVRDSENLLKSIEQQQKQLQSQTK